MRSKIITVLNHNKCLRVKKGIKYEFWCILNIFFSSKFKPYTLREYEEMKRTANARLGGLVSKNNIYIILLGSKFI
jgi:hypothetical protein